MSARASGVSICPSGVRRKMASGAGHAPRSCDDLRPIALRSAPPRPRRPSSRSIALREPARGALELLADVRADARRGTRRARTSPRRRRGGATSSASPRPSTHELAQGVAVERREQQVAHADVELDAPRRRCRASAPGAGVSSSTRSAPTRRRRKSASVRRCGSRPSSASPAPDDEVDERVVGVAAVDRERRDARADDHREREEALADDLAERLEAADPLADALEPSVGADGVERELARLGIGHRREDDSLSQLACWRPVFPLHGLRRLSAVSGPSARTRA